MFRLRIRPYVVCKGNEIDQFPHSSVLSYRREEHVLDTERFDELTRRIEQTQVSRSGLLRGLAGGTLALAGVVVLGSDASAAKRRRRPSLKAVTFDASNGTGFVGKGDVQLAFNWNNRQLQDNATQVSFEYHSTNTYSVLCEYEEKNGNKAGQTFEVDQGKHQTVRGAVNGDPRVKNSKFTGYNLMGWNGEASITGNKVPGVGESCTVGNDDGEVISVTLTKSNGGLSAKFGDNKQLIG
jgi:hypothetical protein